MKKYALISLLSLLCVPAYAQDLFYDYSIIADGFYGYSDYKTKYRPFYKHNHTPLTAELYTSVGYKFNDENTLILGLDLQVSHSKEIEDYNQGKWGENVYATYSFAYGELSAGQIYNAAYQLAVGAPSVGVFRVNNSPITDFIANPNWQRNNRVVAYRTLNSTYLNTDADAPKISYTTPEFYHTKAAFSYTPDSYSRAGLINKKSRYDNRSSYTAGLYSNIDFTWVEVESSLGYAYNRKNNQEISAGLSLYRKGWTLGGSYRKSYTDSHDYALNLPFAENTPYFYDGYRRGQAFNLGIGYEIGPFKTALTYFEALADKTDNKDRIITFANRFSLNKYVALYAAAAYGKYKGDELSMGNSGYAFIGGAELNF